jgi:hypothetical protein
MVITSFVVKSKTNGGAFKIFFVLFEKRFTFTIFKSEIKTLDRFFCCSNRAGIKQSPVCLSVCRNAF